MALGTTMCARASTLSLDEGQALFKKSIYVMLGGMIGGLVLTKKDESVCQTFYIAQLSRSTFYGMDRG
jgi:hypothetical protein